MNGGIRVENKEGTEQNNSAQGINVVNTDPPSEEKIRTPSGTEITQKASDVRYFFSPEEENTKVVNRHISLTTQTIKATPLKHKRSRSVGAQPKRVNSTDKTTTSKQLTAKNRSKKRKNKGSKNKKLKTDGEELLKASSSNTSDSEEEGFFTPIEGRSPIRGPTKKALKSNTSALKSWLTNIKANPSIQMEQEAVNPTVCETNSL